MASNSDSTPGDDKAQHESLVQESDEPERKISFWSLLWKPAVLLLVPLAFVLVSVLLGSSCAYYFHYFYTDNWDYSFAPSTENWQCLPNGTAIPSSALSYTVWDPSQFLDITLGFGSFQFGIAKGIDVGWDLIVGRGGQILLSLLSYRVLSAVLVHSMKTHSASFYIYTAVGFNRGPLYSIWASMRDMWSGNSQEKRILSMVVYASLYLLAFPTFVSTMTGYKTISTPWVNLINEDVMYPAEKIQPVMWLIKDGSRIGLTDDFPIAYNDFACWSSCTPFEANLTKAWVRYADSAPLNDNVSSTFVLNGDNISLHPPRLRSEHPGQLWMHENKTYTWDDMSATCQPGKTYQWGFSSYALLAFFLTTTLYAITMYSLWLRTYLHSRKHRAGQSLGLFRAAMDFADALKTQVGQDCAGKTEKQLTELVKSHELGMRLKDVDDLPPPRGRSMRKVQFNLRHLFKRRR